MALKGMQHGWMEGIQSHLGRCKLILPLPWGPFATRPGKLQAELWPMPCAHGLGRTDMVLDMRFTDARMIALRHYPIMGAVLSWHRPRELPIRWFAVR